MNNLYIRPAGISITIMDPITLVIRLSLTFLLALAFGIERQKSHKPVGFGTFIFVSVGSCGLAVTAMTLAPENPLSIMGAIVTGIGFLGAGALIKTSEKIFGFISAASIWLFAILGLVIGTGEYMTAAVIYVLIWMTLYIDKIFERKGVGSYQKKLVINTNKLIEDSEIRQTMPEGVKYRKISIDLDKKGRKMSMAFLIEGEKEAINSIPKRILEKDWLESFRVE